MIFQTINLNVAKQTFFSQRKIQGSKRVYLRVAFSSHVTQMHQCANSCTKNGLKMNQMLSDIYFSRYEFKVISIGRLCFFLSGTTWLVFNSLHQEMFASGKLGKKLVQSSVVERWHQNQSISSPLCSKSQSVCTWHQRSPGQKEESMFYPHETSKTNVSQRLLIPFM